MWVSVTSFMKAEPMSVRRHRFVNAASMRHQGPVRAITLDLDDTLWPFAPVAQRIQAALEGWAAEHAPAASVAFDADAAREVLATVRRERPDIAHDLGAMPPRGAAAGR